MLWNIVWASLGVLAGIFVGKALQKRGEPERLIDAVNSAVSKALTAERIENRKKDEANIQGSHKEAASFLIRHIEALGVTWDIVEIYNVRTKISQRLLLGLGQDSPILLTAILAAHPSGPEGTYFRMARLANMTPPPNLITPQPDWDVGINQIRDKILVVPQILMFEAIPRAYRHAQSTVLKTQTGESLTTKTTNEVASSPPATPNDEPQQPLVEVEPQTEAQRLEDVEPEIQVRATAALAEAKAAHAATVGGEFEQNFLPPADTAPVAPPAQDATSTEPTPVSPRMMRTFVGLAPPPKAEPTRKPGGEGS